MSSKADVLVLLAMLAEQSGETVSAHRIDFTGQTLLTAGPPEAICKALAGLLETSRRFPTVAEVKAAMGVSEASDEARAAEAASRIEGAIVKFGSAGGSSGFKRQRDWMGELAWMVVDRCGGYQHLCDSTYNDDLPTLKAQWRNLALALCGSAKRGTLDRGPELPQGPSGTHAAIEALAKSLPDPNKERPPF